MVYHCINLHLPSSDDLLVMATEVKAKHSYHTVIILLFYILKNPLYKSFIFSEHLLQYSISGHYITCC